METAASGQQESLDSSYEHYVEKSASYIDRCGSNSAIPKHNIGSRERDAGSRERNNTHEGSNLGEENSRCGFTSGGIEYWDGSKHREGCLSQDCEDSDNLYGPALAALQARKQQQWL